MLSLDRQVIIGSDGFLFHNFDQVSEQLSGAQLLPPIEVMRWVRCLENRHDWAIARNKRAITAIVPEKHPIYVDHLPDSCMIGSMTPLKQITQALPTEILADTISYTNVLLEARKLRETFFRTDLHWIDWGAYNAYHALMQLELRTHDAPLVRPDALRWTPCRFTSGLVFHLENRPSEETALVEFLDGVRVTHVLGTGTFRRGQVDVYEAPGVHGPRLVYFRDSNAFRMIAFLMRSFSLVVALATMDFFYDLVESEQSDLVIAQMAERYLGKQDGHGRVAGFPDDNVERSFYSYTGLQLPLSPASAVSHAPNSEITSPRKGTEETQVRTMLGNHDICNETYTFERESGDVIAQSVILQSDGRIYGIRSRNESYWKIEGDTLSFLDQNKSPTTIFNLVENSENWYMRGGFLGDPLGNTFHLLKRREGEPSDWRWRYDLGREQNPPGKCVFLIRAHLIDEKVWALYTSLESTRKNHDLFIYLDVTNQSSVETSSGVIAHSLSDFRDIGLTQNHSRLMWWCGDFAFYAAAAKMPSYLYYVMIEYDVHVSALGVEKLVELADKLVASDRNRIDSIGTRLRLETSPGDNLHKAAWDHFSPVYTYFFPIIVLSRPAIDYLLLYRKQEALRNLPESDILYCESLVPSALNAAGFVCVDFNHVYPRFYRNDLLIARNRVRGLNTNIVQPLEKFSNLLHPVYSVDQLFEKNLNHATTHHDLDAVLDLVQTGEFGPLSEDKIATFKARADVKRASASL
jgi:hypothetical protein